MSRETATELKNLKVTWVCVTQEHQSLSVQSKICLQEEEARYERLIKLYQEQIDALEPTPEQPAPFTD